MFKNNISKTMNYSGPLFSCKFALDTKKHSMDEIVESIYQAVHGSEESI